MWLVVRPNKFSAFRAAFWCKHAELHPLYMYPLTRCTSNGLLFCIHFSQFAFVHFCVKVHKCIRVGCKKRCMTVLVTVKMEAIMYICILQSAEWVVCTIPAAIYKNYFIVIFLGQCFRVNRHHQRVMLCLEVANSLVGKQWKENKYHCWHSKCCDPPSVCIVQFKSSICLVKEKDFDIPFQNKDNIQPFFFLPISQNNCSVAEYTAEFDLLDSLISLAAHLHNRLRLRKQIKSFSLSNKC